MAGGGCGYTLAGCRWVNLFFFEQETAYEMRITDWSSDVCSSDLLIAAATPSAVFAGATPLLAQSDSPYEGVTIRFLTSSNASQEIGRASCRERVCQYV